MLLTLLSPQTAPATTSAILIGSSNNPSYRSGFYSPRRGGTPKYPSLWDGCVGAWAPSLGQTGLTLRDESVFGNHGTIVGPTNWIVRHGKTGLLFDGNTSTTEYAIRLGKTVFDTSGSYTAHCQFSVDALATGSERSIFSKINFIGRTGFAIATSDFTNEFYIKIADGAGRTNTTIAATANKLTSVAFTYDQTTLRIFVDGIIQSTSTVSRNSDSTGFDAFIGASHRTDNTVSGVFNGVVFDTRFVNRIMSDSEIWLLANNNAFESKRRLAVRSGAASPSGTLAKTLGSVTLTSSGTLSGAATGSVLSTLADATLSATGTLAAGASGTVSRTLDAVTLSSSGTIGSGLTGTVSVTLGAATLSSSGTLAAGASGNVTRTLDNTTLSSSGTVAAGASGTVTRTLDAVTLASTGGAAGSVSGSVSATLAAATCSSSGTLAAGLSGTVVRTLDAVTSSATGTLTNGAIGTVTRTLANATLASGGSLSAGLTAQVNRALESCVVSSSGTLASGLTGTLSVQLASATLQSGNVAVGGLRIKVGGEWKNANAFVKVTGSWKNATPFVKVSGVWK